jgi:hypothetical protein
VNPFTALALGAALQVAIFAVMAKLSPQIYRDHPPTLTFAWAQLALLVLFALLEVTR